MNYLLNLFTLFGDSNLLLANHDKGHYTLLLAAGFSLAIIMWLLCFYFGRLFFKPYRLTIGQHILSALLAMMVMTTVPAYFSASYMQQVFQKIIMEWRDSLVNDAAWNNAEFKLEYYEIKKLGKEDFSKSPPPEQGGHVIPSTIGETISKVSQMRANAAVANFDTTFPLLSVFIGATPKISANVINQDVNNYFKSNAGGTYPMEKAVQLASNQIYVELQPQIPRLIWLYRLGIILKVLFWYTICLSWIAYAALGQIRIYSAHRSSSINS